MTAPHPSIPGVTFKDIPGYPGYCVGDDGSVWSRRAVRGLGPGKGTQGYLSDAWKEKQQGLSVDGYKQVSLRGAPGTRKANTAQVHRLVLMAFVGPRPPGLQARHLNGDRRDNRLCNLAWGTAVENIADRDRHGTTARGERSGRAKITAREAELIRLIRETWHVPLEAIAHLFGVSKRQVGRIASGESWSAQADAGSGDTIDAPRDLPVHRSEVYHAKVRDGEIVPPAAKGGAA